MILGIDLSATATALVAAPLDWDGQWARVRSLVLGESLPRGATDEQRIRRAERIARRIVAFAREHRVSVAYFESYAFSQAKAAHTIAEIGGVVRLELLRADVEIDTAPMSSARKLLLGSVPRADVKVAVYAAVRAAGGRFETADETDAFAVLNWAMSERGGFTFAQEAA